MSKTRTWTLATAVAAVLVLVAGWFLLVAPARGTAAELRQQAVSVEDGNSKLRLRIESLKAQAEKLPELEARLEEIGRQLPPGVEQPTLIRDMRDAAAKAGVDLRNIVPSAPVVLAGGAPAAAAAPVPAPSGGTSPDPAAADPAAADPAAAAAAPTLLSVPVVIDVSGSYAELELFLEELHSQTRLFKVTDFLLTDPSTEETASDLDLSLTGQVFVLPHDGTVVGGTSGAVPSPAAPSSATPGATPGATPAPTDAPTGATPAASATS